MRRDVNHRENTSEQQLEHLIAPQAARFSIRNLVTAVAVLSALTLLLEFAGRHALQSAAAAPSTPVADAGHAKTEKVAGTSSKQSPTEDHYYVVEIKDLELSEEPEGFYRDQFASPSYRLQQALTPRIVLDQPGEAYCMASTSLRAAKVAVRVQHAGDVTGTIFIRKLAGENSVPIRFKLAAGRRYYFAEGFYKAKAEWYARLLSRDLPGAAWFRMQYKIAAEKSGQSATAVRSSTGAQRGYNDTFEIFSGSRALAENLSLADELRIASDDDLKPVVPISSIRGITVREYDWTALNTGISPKLDPLAAYVSHDQHAIFFPTFSGMLNVLDAADEFGTPIMFSMETRAEDAGLKERYQRQLCLETSQLSRLLGPTIIRSVAITGSDPYLRSGTDVTILFDASQAEILANYVRGKHAAATENDPAVKRDAGTIDGIRYECVTTVDRRVSSYLARMDDVVLVTNSLAQVRQTAMVRDRGKKALASLPEYAFMRNRYRLGSNEESAFLMISDATIRRLCGPYWRIGNSRRTRAASILARLTAENQNEMLADPSLKTQLPEMRGLGVVEITPSGARSQFYNTSEFLLPIAEFQMRNATRRERDAYVVWRNNYEQNWPARFDPIGAQLSLTPSRLAVDVTVMPLAAGTQYVDYQRMVIGGKIPPTGADRHDEATMQATIAIGERLRNLARAFLSARGLGETATIYVDRDPQLEQLLAEAADGADLQGLTSGKDWVPRVGVRIEAGLANPDELLKFAPGDLKESRQYRGVQIFVAGGLAEVACPSGAVLASLRPETLNAAIDRELARTAGEPVTSSKPEWIGESMAVQFDENGWQLLDMLFQSVAMDTVQTRSWSNLPILNEWNARYPDRDPLQVHKEIWGTLLLCPAGGEYVWNEKWGTMESTATGHPGEPKHPALAAISPLSRFQLGNFGLTFEDDGLRARVEFLRRMADEFPPPAPIDRRK